MAPTKAQKTPAAIAAMKHDQNTWFVTLEGHEKGPFSPVQLRELVTRRQIVDATLVRRGDLASAVPAGQIRGLLVPLSAPTTVTPLVSSSASRVHQPAARRSQSDSKRVVEDASEADSEVAESVPEGRATAGQRLRSIGIDLVVIGGIAMALLAYAWVLPQRSVAALSANIDATRATQSAQNVANRGEPRPSLADWPTVAIEVEKRIVAKQALIDVEKAGLAKPAPSMTPSRDQILQETHIGNLENELVFLQKYNEFENGRAAQDRAAVAAAATSTGPLQGILIGLALALVCFAAPICVHVSGGTPGHWMMGLRVVGPTRRPVGFLVSLLRHAGSLVPWAHASLLTGTTASAQHDDWSRTEVVSHLAVARGRSASIKNEVAKGSIKPTTRVARRMSA